MPEDKEALLGLTAMVVSAYVRSNRLPQGDLVALIENTHSALVALGSGPLESEPARPIPAVPIKKSITPNAIYSLEDGRPFKSLKRHLRTAYDMSPDEYRRKWGLPGDYPMVAPNYAETRARMAKSMGLGRKASKRRR
ncbi:MucR family transcriptional regulator [Bosea sp. NPDC003192]|uniref:MucR family transcriptional regulator n=1 Tax=Bosea sp. NPDC003192 TaxID=3390551 RepID=UPI003D03B35C